MDIAFLALLAGLVGGTVGLVALCDRLMDGGPR
jgi:hypothetical protein